MELASICRRAHTELEGTAILSRSRGRERWFESTFLQRRVCLSSEPRGYWRKAPHLAAVCGWLGTREGTRRLPTGTPLPFLSNGH